MDLPNYANEKTKAYPTIHQQQSSSSAIFSETRTRNLTSDLLTQMKVEQLPYNSYYRQLTMNTWACLI